MLSGSVTNFEKDAAFLPLEKRQIALPDNGSKRPALHKDWVTRINFLSYVPPFRDLNIVGGHDYITRLELIETDVDLLLRLPHFKFWSQMLFDTSLNTLIKSFLKFSPNCWETEKIVHEYVKSHQIVSKKMFLLFLRMSTYKESNEGYMSADFFGNLHSKYGWLGAFEMSLLCSIYANQSPLLQKLCENVIKHNRSDFKSSFTRYSANVKQTLSVIKMRCGLHVVDCNDLSEEFNPCNSLDVSGLTRIIDLCVDLTSNLLCFADSVPSVVELLFYDTNDLLRHICNFVEVTLKCLFWSVRMLEDSDLSSVLTLKLKTSASNSVEIVRLTLEDYVSKNFETGVVETALVFLQDFIQLYWVRQLFEVDPIVRNLLHALMSWAENGNPNFLKDLDDLMTNLDSEPPSDVVDFDGSSSNGVDNLQKALSEVKQLIPEVDDKVVKYYLLASNLSVEESVNLIFENNLSIPEGASFDDFVEPEKPTFQKVFRKKDEELTPSMMNNIVERYGNVEEGGDDFSNEVVIMENNAIETAPSSRAPDFRTIFENPVGRSLSLEYDDEYDDTYDNVAEVADSFENGDIGFSVQNPNWGAAKWTTRMGGNRNDWLDCDEENSGDQDAGTSNQEIASSNLPQSSYRSSGGYHNKGKNENNKGSFNQRNKVGASSPFIQQRNNQSENIERSVEDTGRVSYASQPRSFRSHRRTDYGSDMDCAETGGGNRKQFSNDNRDPFNSSCGGVRLNNNPTGTRPKEFRQQRAPGKQVQGRSGNGFNKGDNNNFRSDTNRQLTSANPSFVTEGTEDAATNPASELREVSKKPMGRGRGFVNRYNDDNDEHKTKSSNPHNRKAAAARKNNHNVPNFY